MCNSVMLARQRHRLAGSSTSQCTASLPPESMVRTHSPTRASVSRAHQLLQQRRRRLAVLGNNTC